jgi:hypothetical protein
VHLVIGDVSSLSEVNGVDDLIVAIFFIAIQILGLSTMTCAKLVNEELFLYRGYLNLSSGRTANRLIVRLSQANAWLARYSAW